MSEAVKQEINAMTLVESKWYELVTDSPLITVQDRHGARQIEALFAGVARIEEQRAIDAFAERLVRVAKYHRVRALTANPARQRFIRTNGVDRMLHQKFAAAQFHEFDLSEIQKRIRVADDGRYGCDRLQFENDRGRADVPAVQDVIDPGEHSLDL